MRKLGHMEANPRFVVVDGSTTGHCCFDYSVIDTAVSEIAPAGERTICECFEESSAKAIANAMNQCTAKL